MTRPRRLDAGHAIGLALMILGIVIFVAASVLNRLAEGM